MKSIRQTNKKYQPKGFDIIHEDLDIIVGFKHPGFLTVAAKWNRDSTIHSALNDYVRKGNSRSTKCVFVVHRLDQATSGLLVFAKSEDAQQFLKNNWQDNRKTYYAVCIGHFSKKQGRIESFLTEDEDYFVHSQSNNSNGKKAITEYKVLAEHKNLSLVEINLVTGRKNQIRVHMSELGHAIYGDTKYGKIQKKSSSDLLLHSAQLSFNHPYSKKRLNFTALPPKYFNTIFPFNYEILLAEKENP